MAIIRIKRTTGSNLPTGLTFGELAFIGASGGATANRLYIAGPEGVCIWVGAQILNQPSYWSGVTAETTIPTVSAVESRVVAGGGLTFASNLNVNIDVGKFFGKYKRGDVIPALGQTVKWVIEDALSETIVPGVTITFSGGGLVSGTIPFGQTSGISYNVTTAYQIKTIGATAAGATLEWRRVGDSGYTAYSGVFYDNAAPFDVPGVTTTNSAVSGVTLNPGGTADTRAFEYRFIVRDTAGATAGITGQVAIQAYSQPTMTNFAAAAPLRLSAETNNIREKGNTYSSITGTFTQNRSYVPILQWKLQSTTGGVAAGGWADTNQPSAGFQTANSPSAPTVSLNHTAPITADRIDYRFIVVDANGQITVTPTSNSGISFGYLIFYGATGTIPTTSTHIRSLPGVCMAGGTNRYPNPFLMNIEKDLYNNFVVAFPQGVNGISLSQARDITSLPFAVTDSYRENVSTIGVSDRSGNNTQNYTVYRMTQAVPYSDANHIHEITTTGIFP